ncbi:MAG: hypothetical protein RIC55_28415 [Pirellulaceae bacterium]
MIERWANETALRALHRKEGELMQAQARIDALERKLAVVESERDNLAAVVARDRARIKAEGAAYARQQAEAEAMTNERTGESLR